MGVSPAIAAFKFGAVADKKSTGNEFKFGVKPASADEKPESASGFKFGAAVETSKPSDEPTGFKFGSATETSKPSSELPSFKFGASVESSKSSSEPAGFKFKTRELT